MHSCNMHLLESGQITFSCALIPRRVNAKPERRTRDVETVWTFLCVIEHHTMNGVQHRAFSALAIGGKPWPNSHTCRFILGDRDPKHIE